MKIEALVFNLCQKLVKENFIECDYQNRIVKIEVNVQFNVLNKEFCSRLDRILLAFMLQLVESKICDSEVLLRKLKHLLVAVLREPQPR